MVSGLLVLIGCQLLGEAMQRASGVPVPGPVIGLLLLLAVLVIRGGPSSTLESSSRGLLKHLPMLFVPAGTGVLVHLELIRAEWLPITASVLGSSVIAIVATATAMRIADRMARGTETAPASVMAGAKVNARRDGA